MRCLGRGARRGAHRGGAARAPGSVSLAVAGPAGQALPDTAPGLSPDEGGSPLAQEPLARQRLGGCTRTRHRARHCASCQVGFSTSERRCTCGRFAQGAAAQRRTAALKTAHGFRTPAPSSHPSTGAVSARLGVTVARWLPRSASPCCRRRHWAPSSSFTANGSSRGKKPARPHVLAPDLRDGPGRRVPRAAGAALLWLPGRVWPSRPPVLGLAGDASGLGIQIMSDLPRPVASPKDNTLPSYSHVFP